MQRLGSGRQISQGRPRLPGERQCFAMARVLGQPVGQFGFFDQVERAALLADKPLGSGFNQVRGQWCWVHGNGSAGAVCPYYATRALHLS